MQKIVTYYSPFTSECLLPPHACPPAPPQVMPHREAAPEEASETAREASLTIKFGVDMLNTYWPGNLRSGLRSCYRQEGQCLRKGYNKVIAFLQPLTGA